MRRLAALCALGLLATGCASSAPPAPSTTTTPPTSSSLPASTTTSRPAAPQSETFRLDRPFEGEVLSGLPVVVSGSANTFEATFIAELQTPSGDVLDHQVVHASAGTGNWGTFEVGLGGGLSVLGPEVVVLYESSAKDGQPIHQLRIPVVIAPARAATTTAP